MADALTAAADVVVADAEPAPQPPRAAAPMLERPTASIDFSAMPLLSPPVSRAAAVATSSTAQAAAGPSRGRGTSGPQPPNTKVYIVQAKDTVPGIALKFGMPQGQLVSLNRIHNNMIFAGQQLYVRADSEAAGASPALPAATAATATTTSSAHTAVGDAVTTMDTHDQPVLAKGQTAARAPGSPELAPVGGSSIILFNENAWYRSPTDGLMEGRMVVTAQRFMFQSRRVNLSVPVKRLKECVLLHHLREEFGLEKDAEGAGDVMSEMVYKYFRLRAIVPDGQNGAKAAKEGQKFAFQYYDFAVRAASYEKLFEALMIHGGFDSMVSEIFMGNDSEDSMPGQAGAAPSEAISVAKPPLPPQQNLFAYLQSFASGAVAQSAAGRSPTSDPLAMHGGDSASEMTASSSAADVDGEGRPRRSSFLMRLGPSLISTLSSAAGSTMGETGVDSKRRRTSLSVATDEAQRALDSDARADMDEDDWEALGLEDVMPEHGTTESADARSVKSVESARIGPSLNRNTELLTMPQVIKLAALLPGRLKVADWQLVYSTFVHGITLTTLFAKMAENDGPSIMIVRDNDGYIFGGFATEPWHSDFAYYGSGESFLFKLEPEFKLFRWTHKNNFFQYGQPEYIAMGGGGTFGLFLDHDLCRGSSSPCSTYDNEVLSSTSDFICLGLEIWGFQR